MSFFKSFIYSIQEANYNPVTLTHSILYAATVTYLRILKNLLKFESESFRNHVSETYHSKVVTLEDATKFITVNKNIELRDLDQVLPFKYAKDVILKNPQNIIAYECACRAQKKDPCRPTNVCLVVGEPFADLIKVFQPFRSRRVSPEEAIKILKEEDDQGHIHTAWFKTAMLNRFYTICNCCRCCCLGIKFMKEYSMKMLMPSGYCAVAGDECLGCGECAKYCQFDAIQMLSYLDNGQEKKTASVISEKCFGCGICESKCKRENISLQLDPEKGMPLNIEDLSRASVAGQ